MSIHSMDFKRKKKPQVQMQIVTNCHLRKTMTKLKYFEIAGINQIHLNRKDMQEISPT